MATQNFDQLNNLRGYAETWFSKMEVSDKDKKRRVDLAMDFTEIILMLFDMILESQLAKDVAKAFLVERIKIIADNYVGKENTAYITNWSRLEAEKIVEDTYKLVEETKEAEKEEAKQPEVVSNEPMEEIEVKEESNPDKPTIHFDEYDVDIPKEEYPTSDFRGMLLGVECATSVANYDDFFQAVEKYGATRKVWISEADGRVRATHDEAHGQERPVAKLFDVGGSELMFPGDITHGADMKEIYNCRCHVEYLQPESNYVANDRFDAIMKLQTRYVNTGGKRNEIPLTEQQKALITEQIRKQGFKGQIIFSEYSNTSLMVSTEGPETTVIIVGTDAYPEFGKTDGTANEMLSMEAGIAHEVVGHYEAYIKGTTQNDNALEEAQASARASLFGEGLTDKDREMLMKDAYDRLEEVGLEFDDVKHLLDIEKR